VDAADRGVGALSTPARDARSRLDSARTGSVRVLLSDERICVRDTDRVHRCLHHHPKCVPPEHLRCGST